MRWSDKEIQTKIEIAKSLLICIILILLLLGIILGRISYLQIIDILETRPTQGFIVPIKLPKLGLLSPFGYGDFREIYIRVFYKEPGWLILKIGNHVGIFCEIPQGTDLKQGFWTSWKEKQQNIEEFEQTHNSWLVQEFGTYAEIYIQADFETRKVLIVLFGEDGRIFRKTVLATLSEGACGGGFQELFWHKK